MEQSSHGHEQHSSSIQLASDQQWFGWPGLAESKNRIQWASLAMFLHDPRIIRKQGEEKRSNRDMEAHRQEEETEEDMEDVLAPGSRGYGRAR
jgi:hypothetical protein